MATSDSSVQVGPIILVDVGSLSLLFHIFYCFFCIKVWWESVPLRSKVIGYEVFYSMTAVEDLDQVCRYF